MNQDKPMISGYIDRPMFTCPDCGADEECGVKAAKYYDEHGTWSRCLNCTDNATKGWFLEPEVEA